MRTISADELSALRRAAFGPRPSGVEASAHARDAVVALERLRALELPDAPDEPVAAEPAAHAPWRPSRRLLVVLVGALAIVALAASGIAAWRLAHPPLEPLPGNVARLGGLGVGELRTVANWGGRSILVGDWLDHPGLECIVVAYGVDGGGAACGEPPTVGLPIDPGALGTSTQTTYELAEFTWHRGRGVVIQYQGETTLIAEPDTF